MRRKLNEGIFLKITLAETVLTLQGTSNDIKPLLSISFQNRIDLGGYGYGWPRTLRTRYYARDKMH